MSEENTTKTSGGKITVEVPTEKSVTTKKVTSDETIDFPSLGWGINKGDTRELPADEEAQKAILSNRHITIVK